MGFYLEVLPYMDTGSSSGSTVANPRTRVEALGFWCIGLNWTFFGTGHCPQDSRA